MCVGWGGVCVICGYIKASASDACLLFSLKMGKGFFISKPVGVVCIILGAGAVATIIALSVVYSQEKEKNITNNVSPTDGGGTTAPEVTTAAPSNEPWDQYRLPKSLVPISYNLTLWPRLKKDNTTGLYNFTGKEEQSVCPSAVTALRHF